MPITVSGFSVTLHGRVRETTQTEGTNSYELDGAQAGKYTFISKIGGGNFTIYTVEAGNDSETAIGQVVAGSPPTLTRALILESSNNNLAVSWGPGTKAVFCDVAAAALHGLQSQIDTLTTNLAGASFANRIKTTVFTSNGTLTTDADCLFAFVRIVGGGGGGGGAVANDASHESEGGGGGGGEYAEGWFTAAQLGASRAVTIGAGGTGTPGSGGGTGGTTNFGGLMTAIGGTGGGAGPTGALVISVTGGGGGDGGTGGTLRIPGSAGGTGSVRPSSVSTSTRGCANFGGSSHLSGNTKGLIELGGQFAGQAYGGGGSGTNSGQNGVNETGSPGASGLCIVVEFCKV